MCQSKSIESSLGTVFLSNVTHTEQNNSTDLPIYLPVCFCQMSILTLLDCFLPQHLQGKLVQP